MKRLVGIAVAVILVNTLFAGAALAKDAAVSNPAPLTAQSPASPALTAQATAANIAPGTTPLHVGRTYTNYDITGDGKADRIQTSWIGKVKPYPKSSYRYNAGLVLKVNGKKALTIGKDKFKAGVDGYELSLLTLKNGKKYLYVSGRNVNSVDHIDSIYAYKGGKLKVAYNLFKLLDSSAKKSYVSYGLRSPRVTGVLNNTIRLRCMMTQCMVGVADFNTALKYKSGKLVVAPRTADLKTYYGPKGSYLSAQKAIRAYKDKTGSKKAFKIKKGQKVVPQQIYVKNKAVRVKVKAGGKTGWIKLVRTGIKVSSGHSGSTWWNKNQYFGNISAAG